MTITQEPAVLKQNRKPSPIRPPTTPPPESDEPRVYISPTLKEPTGEIISRSTDTSTAEVTANAVRIPIMSAPRSRSCAIAANTRKAGITNAAPPKTPVSRLYMAFITTPGSSPLPVKKHMTRNIAATMSIYGTICDQSARRRSRSSLFFCMSAPFLPFCLLLAGAADFLRAVALPLLFF